MIVDLDKNSINSLRKGRLQGFQADFLEAYALFQHHMLEPTEFTIKQFDLISQKSNLRFLLNCKAEEQQEDEYVQLLYKALLDNYLLKKSQSKQIFCIFALYLFYCRQDKKKKIKIDCQIIAQLKKLLLSNQHNIKCDFIKIIKRLISQAVSYNIKYGISNSFSKQTIQGQKKSSFWPCNSQKKQSSSQNQSKDQIFFNQIRKQMPDLQALLNTYQLQKKNFNKFQGQNEQVLECWGVKNVTKRIQRLMQKYEKRIQQIN